MAGSQAIVQPLFDDLILHISPDKFYFESLTATQVGKKHDMSLNISILFVF